jgi:TatD DNase family protein
MKLVDSHAHLDYIHRDGGDVDAVMARAAETGVAWLVNPSVTPDRFLDVLAMVQRFSNVYAAVAVHPTDVQEADENGWQEDVRRMLAHPKVVAIGETGLDYYRDTTHAALQQTFFRACLAMAQEHNKPVIVHDRDAHEDVYRLISEYPGVRGVMHCFSGDASFAKAMMDKGFYISFAGNVTFKNAHLLQDAARSVPLERLLIETDAPFLSPMPFRGQPNEPARVSLVAQKIADLHGVPIETLAQVTSANAHNLFSV